MASIKVLLRTSKLLKNGEHPIVLRFIKDRKAKFVFTGQSCSAKLWDFKDNKPSRKHPNKFELDLFIANKIANTQKVILNLENEEKEYSTEQIKRRFKVSSKKITVFKFIDEIVAQLISTNKIGNASIYKDCKRALEKFRNDKDLVFLDIDIIFLKRFERHLMEREVTGNSISVYMRSLRAIFNRAIQEGYCKKENYPFSEYKVSKLDTTTAKRALTKDQMQKIIDLGLKHTDPYYDAKQLFLFSYYNRGINFTDMALLKWENIREGRLNYIRAKTGKSYNIGLLDPAKEILDYYAMFQTKKSSYVFPILDSEKHKTPIQIDYRIEKMNKKINKDLKEIAKKIELEFNLTTYVARHSYATIMKRSGVSTALISESLGHNNERTTQIYLDSFDNQVLDDANLAIL